MKKSIKAIIGCIILLAMVPKTIIKHIVAVLKFPVKVNDFITYAKSIYKAMNGNVNFPASQAALVILNNDIGTLVTMQTNLKTKPPTSTVEDRNAAMEIVKNELRALRNDVQKVADLNQAKSEVIIKSASMSIKKVNIKQKQKNSVKEGKVSGTVVSTAEPPGPHEWQMSKDQITIINLPATSSANTVAEGLTPGEVWYFRSRPILRKGKKGDWTEWMRIMVR